MTRLISNINDNRIRYVVPVEISSSLSITGSLLTTAGITGSIQGTASFATTASYSTTSVTSTSSSYSATASYVNNLQQDVQITGSLSTKGVFSVGRITTSNAVIQRSQSPAGSYSFIFAGGTGLVDTYPYTMADTHAATMELRAGDPTTDQYGGGIIFSANGNTSPLGEGNAVIFKARSGVNTYSETMRIASNGSVTCNSITASLQGTSSYASTSKSTSGRYICQGTLASNQSIPTDADTIVQFGDDIDPNNWYDASTYRFTPTIAGYYSISAAAWLSAANATTNQFNFQCRKNGNQIVIVQCPLPNDVGQSLTFTRMVYMNGSGDYIDFTVYQGAGTPVDLNGGNGTWFTAHLIST